MICKLKLSRITDLVITGYDNYLVMDKYYLDKILLKYYDYSINKLVNLQGEV